MQDYLGTWHEQYRTKTVKFEKVNDRNIHAQYNVIDQDTISVENFYQRNGKNGSIKG